MTRLGLFSVLCLSANAAWAVCPPAPDRTAELMDLFSAARAAETELEGRAASDAMWKIWTDPPDEAAGALLDRGMAARRVYDFISARDAFDRLIDYCPDWAEGWNQRAFVHFLSEDFDAALVDLERTVEINPEHVGALSGLALTLTALNREDEAQSWLRKALELNPWIPERHMLKKPTGQEL